MHIPIYSISKSNFSAYPWLHGATEAVKTSYASPNYTLIEEQTFLDTKTTNQVTAFQDHSLYAVTQREERKYCSLRQRDPPNPSFSAYQKPENQSRIAAGSLMHIFWPSPFFLGCLPHHQVN